MRYQGQRDGRGLRRSGCRQLHRHIFPANEIKRAHAPVFRATLATSADGILQGECKAQGEGL
jgi:hypothetical protein